MTNTTLTMSNNVIDGNNTFSHMRENTIDSIENGAQIDLFSMVNEKEVEAEKFLNTIINMVRPEEWANVLFKVGELPLFINKEDMIATVNENLESDFEETDDFFQFDSYKALVNKTTGGQISIVTDKYHVVDNTEVLEHFESMLREQGIKFEYGFAVTARNGRKTIMEIILPEMVIDLGNGDTQEMRIYIQNSFDGGNSIKLDMGFFRHMCSNMALMHGNAEVQYKTSHIGNATDRIKTQFNFYITEKYNEAKDFCQNLTTYHFANDDHLRNMVEKEDNKVVSDRDRSKVMDVWETFYKSSFGHTYWGIYNAYTHHITHNMNISENGKMKKLTELSRLFDNLMKEVDKASDLSDSE